MRKNAKQSSFHKRKASQQLKCHSVDQFHHELYLQKLSTRQREATTSPDHITRLLLSTSPDYSHKFTPLSPDMNSNRIRGISTGSTVDSEFDYIEQNFIELVTSYSKEKKSEQAKESMNKGLMNICSKYFYEPSFMRAPATTTIPLPSICKV